MKSRERHISYYNCKFDCTYYKRLIIQITQKVEAVGVVLNFKLNFHRSYWNYGARLECCVQENGRIKCFFCKKKPADGRFSEKRKIKKNLMAIYFKYNYFFCPGTMIAIKDPGDYWMQWQRMC